MNNRGKNHEIGLPNQNDGYLSWQDPESGEWMVLTPTGSPFTGGERNELPAKGLEGNVGLPRRTTDRFQGRYRNWRSPFGNGHAVA
ncbi:MAG: hypothetical protein ACI87O_000728 [Planctomycetota bacterium]|jgi:hypothetical protein